MDVFLCYRRDDAAGHVGRLREDLKVRLGGAHVFQDVSSLAPGDRFEETIRGQIAAADVVFVVMGRNWEDAVDATGRRRLDDPHDPVRIEIETALAMHKRTVPVLVGGASLPAATVLPDSVAPLLEGNSAEVRDPSWPSDLDRVLRSLGAHRHRPVLRSPRALTALVVALLVAVVAVAVLVDRGRQPSGSGATTAGPARSGGPTIAATVGASATSAATPSPSPAAPTASAPTVPDPAVGATSATLVEHGGLCEEPRPEDLQRRPTTPIGLFRDEAKVEVHRWWARDEPSRASMVVMIDATVTEFASGGRSLGPGYFSFIVAGFPFTEPPSCVAVFENFGDPKGIIPAKGGKIRVLLTAMVGRGAPVQLYFGGQGAAQPAIVTLDQ